MIPELITKTNIVEALGRIVRDGIPSRRRARGYCLVADGKHFPPKYTIALAHQGATGEFLKPLQGMATYFGILVAVVLLFPAAVSYIDRTRKKRLLDRQQNIESIRDLPWRQFEELVAEAFRRDGFTVIENAYAGADGGVDIRLGRGGESYLVQCKNWRKQSVGVATVREMFGVLEAESARGAFIVCSGTFTAECWFSVDSLLERSCEINLTI